MVYILRAAADYSLCLLRLHRFDWDHSKHSTPLRVCFSLLHVCSIPVNSMLKPIGMHCTLCLGPPLSSILFKPNHRCPAYFPILCIVVLLTQDFVHNLSCRVCMLVLTLGTASVSSLAWRQTEHQVDCRPALSSLSLNPRTYVRTQGAQTVFVWCSCARVTWVTCLHPFWRLIRMVHTIITQWSEYRDLLSFTKLSRGVLHKGSNHPGGPPTFEWFEPVQLS